MDDDFWTDDGLDSIEEALEGWRNELRKDHENRPHRKWSRIDPLLESLSDSIARYCRTKGETPPQFKRRLELAQDFSERLDDALHPKGGIFAEEGYVLWAHRDVPKLMTSTTPTQREGFLEFAELEALTSEYLATEWLHCPYLDWVLLDAMTVGRIVAALELLMSQRGGFSYAIFAGVRWKMFLWKLIMGPVSFLFSWVAPAFLFYYVGQWSLPWIGLVLGVAYYGFSLWMLARWVWFRIRPIFSGKPSPYRQALNVLDEAMRAYLLLAGPVMHVGAIRKAFERATEKGVIWDQRTFHILDRVAERGSFLWDHNPQASYKTS